MTKKTLIKGLISTAMLATMALPMVALAQGAVTSNELLPGQIATELGQQQQDLRITIARIVRTAMSLLGIIAVMIILYGGFKWMTSGGSDDAVGDSKKIITAGIIGLIIILTAYAIASFAINSLITATT
jgi:hypothetical protein